MSLFRRSSISGPGTPESPRTGIASQLTLPSRDAGPILVAVDGNPRGWDALEWAAAESASRGCVLRIMHVFRSSPLFVGAPLEFSVNQWNVSATEAARRILTEAVTRARIVAPDIQITICGHQGITTAEILREGKRDALIVLGRGRTGGRIRSAMSVERRVTRRATSPVAVVTLAPSAAGGPSAGRVVVALERTHNPVEVLGFAFRSAQRRGVGVTLIQRYPASDPMMRGAAITASSSTTGSIEHSVRLCRQMYPEVDLTQRIHPRCSLSSLLAESKGAALLVVGARRRRLFPVAFGLSRKDRLHLAQSPVAIVRSGRLPAGLAGDSSEQISG